MYKILNYCIIIITVGFVVQPNTYATIIAEGKTKIIRTYPSDPSLVLIESKDDITAGDGIKHDIIKGKAALATDTTCNVFRLLKSCGIPVAFTKQINGTTFLAPRCTMIHYEVVVRREAHGSMLKRYPHLKKGQVFPRLVLEFFLKTSDKNWHGIPIPKDDPFIQFKNNKMQLFKPDVPFYGQEPFLTLDDYPVKDRPELFEAMGTIAKKTFLVLEKAWQNVGCTLVDFKVEFGFDTAGNLLLADVIDNDSWRVLHNNNYIDKQVYRDGGDLNQVTTLYTYVRNLTNMFTVPKQRIIVWRASEQDNIEVFMNTIKPYLNDQVCVTCVTTSVHKEPVRAYQHIQQLVQETPDCIVIAYVGKSNGAGPVLAATTTIPVITVPAAGEQFHEDVWSSLRCPSNVPLMTVLSPQNALLAALTMLATHNPLLYMQLRLSQENRLINVIETLT